ncbi:hypothetical protein [Wolbachia endosymbiont of Chironomus riparius]|uniref:hypothetical protein n=1 Tax=Wolbachia endosymbiont of Chironomus riparius TaxID=2883238 RepID=UPI0020A12519|nr:hypothetical protein [Wolbachia endosymbiont of Chironomus riparius]
MNRLPNNSKTGQSQVTKWEIIKNCEYIDNCLSRITTLYVIKITESSDSYQSSDPEVSTILVRVDVAGENIFLNKSIIIEIMEKILPYKFSSKKKNNISRLEDLYNYLCSIISENLPKEMLESFIREYNYSANLLKTIT